MNALRHIVHIRSPAAFRGSFIASRKSLSSVNFAAIITWKNNGREPQRSYVVTHKSSDAQFYKNESWDNTRTRGPRNTPHALIIKVSKVQHNATMS